MTPNNAAVTEELRQQLTDKNQQIEDLKAQFQIKDQWVSLGQSIENRGSGLLKIFIHSKQYWHLLIVNLQGNQSLNIICFHFKWQL